MLDDVRLVGRVKLDDERDALADQSGLHQLLDPIEQLFSLLFANHGKHPASVARADAAKRGVDEIMVIGGSDIFAATIPMADRLEITHVHASPEGDAVFPTVDEEIWQETSREEHFAGPGDDADFAFATYIRR